MLPHAAEPTEKHKNGIGDLRERVCRTVAWALTTSEGSTVRLPGVHGRLDLPQRDSGLITFA